MTVSSSGDKCVINDKWIGIFALFCEIFARFFCFSVAVGASGTIVRVCPYEVCRAFCTTCAGHPHYLCRPSALFVQAVRTTIVYILSAHTPTLPSLSRNQQGIHEVVGNTLRGRRKHFARSSEILCDVIGKDSRGSRGDVYCSVLILVDSFVCYS